MIDLQLLCNGVIISAKEAGAFIRTQRKSFSTEMVEYKGTNDLVSYVDKTAEQMLVDPAINDGWTRPLIMTLPFSCLAAFIWGPAFAAVLFVDDTAEG